MRKNEVQTRKKIIDKRVRGDIAQRFKVWTGRRAREGGTKNIFV